MSLGELRAGGERWRIGALAGPNLTRLDLSRELRTWDDLSAQLVQWGRELGVEVRPFGSNHEGRLLEHLHATGPDTDGYLVNPGGLMRVGESLRHALKETYRPVVEIHHENVEQLGGGSIFTPGAIGLCAGLRQHSWLAGLVGLACALDDRDFLHPEGGGVSHRPDGRPRSLFG